MTRLFHRSAELAITKSKGFFADGLNTILIRDLRVRFHVEKRSDEKPNKCEVTISNLSDNSRAAIRQKPLRVRMDVGYSGQMERLFIGDMIFGRSTIADPDWETMLQVSDGGRAYGYARINRSFKAGVQLRECIADVAKALELPLPALEGSEFDTRLATGVSLFGPAQREMTRLLRPIGYGWSVQDGNIQILKRDQARKDLAEVISEETGMVGSPELGPPKDKGKPPLLTVTSLLKPRLKPRGLISLKSRTHNGTFRLHTVTHEGDTHGEQWQTTMEAVPV